MDYKYTPTPWIAGKFSSIVGCPIINSQGNVIADTKFQGKEKAEANAAFIVRACNAHVELVAAAKQMRVACALIPVDNLSSYADKSVEEALAADKRLAAAIALAEGK